MKANIELSGDLVSKLNQLKVTRSDNTLDELIVHCIERGVYDLNYRTKRNKQQWAEFKAYRKEHRTKK
jgi:hypothetical protein